MKLTDKLIKGLSAPGRGNRIIYDDATGNLYFVSGWGIARMTPAGAVSAVADTYLLLGDPAHKIINASLFRVDEVLEIYRSIRAPVLAVIDREVCLVELHLQFADAGALSDWAKPNRALV